MTHFLQGNLPSLSRRRLLRGAAVLPVAAAPLAVLGPVHAFAQEFPTHPLRLIVPFPAGGGTDAISRLAAERLSPLLGQPVVVMNKAGAAGGIASEFVVSEPADGYTLLVAGQGQMFINKALGGRLAYEPETDFSYVGMLGAFPNILVVNPEAIPSTTIGEFIRLARDKPGILSYGSNGVGSLSHLTTEMLAGAAGVKFLHVPYQGAAPQMADLLAGRIGFTIVGPQGMLPHIQSGKLRALAVSTAERFAALPDVPTLVESGFPTLDVPVWFAAFVRAQTPAPVVARLRATLASITATEPYAAGLAKSGAQRMNVPVESAQARFASENRMWVEAVERTGAKGG